MPYQNPTIMNDEGEMVSSTVTLWKCHNNLKTLREETSRDN
jgi:hypothetical protein